MPHTRQKAAARFVFVLAFAIMAQTAIPRPDRLAQAAPPVAPPAKQSPLGPVRQGAPTDLTYIYDVVGRLRGVVDPAVNAKAAVYFY
jgi:hypothetical protein